MVTEAIVRALIERFGDQILACYQTGSRLDGTAVAGSDYDIALVFRGAECAERRQALRALREDLSARFGVAMDIEARDEPEPNTSLDPVLKLGGHLLFGEDIRERLPLMPIDDWARDRLHTTFYRTATLFDRPRPLSFPLTYPNPADDFFGYTPAGTTRNLVRHVTWAATALIAHIGRTYVERKAKCAPLYRDLVRDGFEDFVETLYRRCKLEWQYAIPDDRAALRDLCAQTLTFETHILGIYRVFLLGELRGAHAARREKAAWVLGKVTLADPEIAAALRAGAPDTKA